MAPGRKRVLPFLPWLLVTSARLDTRELTNLATARGLGAMLELSLTSSPEGHLAVRGADGLRLTEMNVRALMDLPPSAPGEEVQAPANGTQASTSGHRVQSFSPDARESEVLLLIQAAACLQRLAFRRQGSSYHHSSKERTAVLLHCAAGVEAKSGNLLAGWLHWYQGMPLQEAVLSAELATGHPVQLSLLEEATEQLIRSADEHIHQVVVTWKYGALNVAVAGDIVGGWQNSVNLVRCTNPAGCKGATSRGHFFLPITGLKPGAYFYKFIVDGTWTVDPSAPKVIDTSGNYNNVMEVHARPPAVTAKERLQMARWKAAHIALDSKMTPALN